MKSFVLLALASILLFKVNVGEYTPVDHLKRAWARDDVQAVVGDIKRTIGLGDRSAPGSLDRAEVQARETVEEANRNTLRRQSMLSEAAEIEEGG